MLGNWWTSQIVFCDFGTVLEKLKFLKHCAHWAPKILTDNHKQNHYWIQWLILSMVMFVGKEDNDTDDIEDDNYVMAEEGSNTR